MSQSAAGHSQPSETAADQSRSLRVSIRTLTPLWAGSTKSDCDHIDPDFIMESLRWWYESLARGLGASACDPGSEERCPEPHASLTDESETCSACSLFGTAALPGRFRLEVSETTTPVFRSEDGDLLRIVAGGKGKSARLGPGLVGTADFEFIISDEGGESVADLKATLKVLLKFIESWGALGARAHIGYGVVQLLDAGGAPLAVTVDEVERFVATATRSRETRPAAGASFPNLASAVLAKMPLHIGDRARFDGCETPDQAGKLAQWLANHGSVPLAPSVRKQLRSRSGSSRDTQPNHLFACTTHFRRGTFLGSSFAYERGQAGQPEYEVRLWVHHGPDHSGEVDLLVEALPDTALWSIVLDDESGEINRAETNGLELRQISGSEAVRELLYGLA